MIENKTNIHVSYQIRLYFSPENSNPIFRSESQHSAVRYAISRTVGLL